MKKNSFWFTLIEMLVVIVIIWILAISIKSFNFNKSMDKEYLLKYRNEVFTILEKTRNDSLLWKSLSWNNLIIPTKRVITITKSNWTNSWTVSLKNYSWSSLINWYNENITIPKYFSINNIKCNSEILSTLDIEYTWNQITLSWSDCNTDKITWEIEVKYKALTWSISINTISNLIQKN